MKRISSVGICLGLLLLVACRETPVSVPGPSAPLTFLALGDSYTIGQGVPIEEAWPIQLADTLHEKGIDMANPRIIARTGWRTDNLIQAIADSGLTETYDLVSLLIGVNNQFQGKPLSQYEVEFPQLLQTAINRADGDPERVFVLSIPDYGVTPVGSFYNPDTVAKEIDIYNNLARGICDSAGVDFYFITDISRMAKTNPSLVARDGLHPSGKMYTLWISRIWPLVIQKL